MPSIPEFQKKGILQMIKQQKERNNPIDFGQLKKLIAENDNLSDEDFVGILSPEELQMLVVRNAQEEATYNEIMGEWSNILMMPSTSSAEKDAKLEKLRTVERKVTSYLGMFSLTKHAPIAEIESLHAEVRKQIGILTEGTAWDALDKNNYNALMSYSARYPDTAHKDEIDDLMWQTVTAAPSMAKLSRYIADMPMGRHVGEANEAINSYQQWEEIKRTRDILRIKEYMDRYATSPFINEARALYYTLRDAEIEEMKKNPSGYDVGKLELMEQQGIFTKYELMDEGLVTEESWENMRQDRSMFPPLKQAPDPNIQAPEDSTDIFFFGTPSTGKTCLLMGLAGANGQGYTLDYVRAGGHYAADLSMYVNGGITPGSTFGSFVTVINGIINEHTKKGDIVRHKVNLIEMSGEEFAVRIANNPDGKLSFEEMGTGATNLLKNDNRKVFFIIVDPTRLKVPTQYLEDVKDADGNVVDQIVRKVYTSQNVILAKLTALFMQPENQKIMEKVDAIHFIVTKADTLGDTRSARNMAALDLLHKDYAGPVTQLKDYIRSLKRINYSTNYTTQFYTFSLGRFYLGDVFDFDATDTLELIDAIKEITWAYKEKSWWDRFRDVLD